MRNTRFSERSRRSSAFSSVVKPPRLPSSTSAWATQFMIDCADGSNSRASPDGDRPSSRTNRTNSALYSDGHGARVRPPMIDSPLDPPRIPGSGCQPNRVSSSGLPFGGWLRLATPSPRRRGWARRERGGPWCQCQARCRLALRRQRRPHLLLRSLRRVPSEF